jgi:hypothetical protein
LNYEAPFDKLKQDDDFLSWYTNEVAGTAGDFVPNVRKSNERG